MHTLQNALPREVGTEVSKGPLAPRSNGDQLKAWRRLGERKVEFEDG